MIDIEVQRGDITKLDVDAIVNAANERMLGGGGVDGAIHRAAGPELLAACRVFPETKPGVRCPTGAARVTSGFRLPARYVIHTVGPVWNGGIHSERDLLASCYRQSLWLAEAVGAASIAFPAISCGIYGFPIVEAAEISVRTIRLAAESHTAIRSAVLVAFDDEVFDAWTEAAR
ncbi:O-acetyl-ADP-ribose deacetylase [Rubripirellula tenax]|uniref:O-acetyl-ADP-ribose deacetylase n=1 Tax=Rubripirellula tenax TaxID=2528015 RepID=A0A5C6FB91_9BACT|nr:O-acetyl-ADP-ribose deacetylase [Rubripirellula tenax]TWU58708.1 O-acetyl-ADP-ribose deacetylase [Rubripirellula tenax]